MKIEITKAADSRPLVAVVGCTGDALYLRHTNGTILYLNKDGIRYAPIMKSLEEAARAEAHADQLGGTPVYKGDTITIKF